MNKTSDPTTLANPNNNTPRARGDGNSRLRTATTIKAMEDTQMAVDTRTVATEDPNDMIPRSTRRAANGVMEDTKTSMVNTMTINMLSKMRVTGRIMGMIKDMVAGLLNSSNERLHDNSRCSRMLGGNLERSREARTDQRLRRGSSNHSLSRRLRLAGTIRFLCFFRRRMVRRTMLRMG
jgi:hypothetical protein